MNNELSKMIGRTFVSVTGSKGDDVMVFTDTDGNQWEFYHSQDCCECVRIEDIIGDLKDLIGSPLLMAEEATNSDNPPQFAESFTWTFYKFATVNGYVTVRWLGKSNGYYSESVDIRMIPAGGAA